MKTVNEDPAAFYREGGWNFLGGGENVSRPEVFILRYGTDRLFVKQAGEESSTESESGSEFEMDEDDFEDESSEDESEFEDEASDESIEEEELSDSGEDWDELEEKARRGKSMFYA